MDENIYTITNSDGEDYEINVSEYTASTTTGEWWYSGSVKSPAYTTPQQIPNNDWNNNTWSSGTTTTYTPIVDADETMNNQIKVEQGIEADVLGTIFIKDGKIYMRKSGGKTILLGEVGDEKVGKKISIAVTKKRLKEIVK